MFFFMLPIYKSTLKIFFPPLLIKMVNISIDLQAEYYCLKPFRQIP